MLAEAPPVADSQSRPTDFASAVQGTLFHSTNVIPFEQYAPVRPENRPPRTRPAQAKTGSKPAVRRPSRVSENQEQLDFLPSAHPRRKTLGTTVEAVIFCDAPVATTVHRALAAALDWSMVLLAYGLFLLVFAQWGGEFDLTNRVSTMMFVAMLPLLGMAYGLIWTIAGTETAGMRWMHLRLVTFVGFPPEPRHRVLRFFGSVLSLCTLIGLLWSIVDEENLTWQDHISGTFPTPSELEEQVFRRR